MTISKFLDLHLNSNQPQNPINCLLFQGLLPPNISHFVNNTLSNEQSNKIRNKHINWDKKQNHISRSY